MNTMHLTNTHWVFMLFFLCFFLHQIWNSALTWTSLLSGTIVWRLSMAVRWWFPLQAPTFSTSVLLWKGMAPKATWPCHRGTQISPLNCQPSQARGVWDSREWSASTKRRRSPSVSETRMTHISSCRSSR